MKKILITAANTAKAYQLAHLLSNQNQVVFGDEEFQSFVIPKQNSVSYAHELLNICLNHNIGLVYPLKFKEVKALAEAKVLFAEYGIEIAIPDLLTAHQFNELQSPKIKPTVAYKLVENYTELSGKLLSLGYPEQKFALSQANDQGNFIFLDDAVNDFNDIWTKINRFSFLQMGKLLNHKNMVPIKIFPINNEVICLDILFEGENIAMLQNTEKEIFNKIQEIGKTYHLQGFYEFAFSGNEILRIKSNTYD